ncbi:MAG: hypothetical protein CM15mP120_27470 [Pseudomonadota bacterium]|nr:MAG: hypothetical protein CM15mP120_27470 [Pseudomonadota bacterium]
MWPADVNGDGYPDVLVAAELAHLIYLQNPGPKARLEPWPRLILPMTQGQGSYLRVFLPISIRMAKWRPLQQTKARNDRDPKITRAQPQSIYCV